MLCWGCCGEGWQLELSLILECVWDEGDDCCLFLRGGFFGIPSEVRVTSVARDESEAVTALQSVSILSPTLSTFRSLSLQLLPFLVCASVSFFRSFSSATSPDFDWLTIGEETSCLSPLDFCSVSWLAIWSSSASLSLSSKQGVTSVDLFFPSFSWSAGGSLFLVDDCSSCLKDSAWWSFTTIKGWLASSSSPLSCFCLLCSSRLELMKPILRWSLMTDWVDVLSADDDEELFEVNSSLPFKRSWLRVMTLDIDSDTFVGKEGCFVKRSSTDFCLSMTRDDGQEAVEGRGGRAGGGTEGLWTGRRLLRKIWCFRFILPSTEVELLSLLFLLRTSLLSSDRVS